MIDSAFQVRLCSTPWHNLPKEVRQRCVPTKDQVSDTDRQPETGVASIEMQDERLELEKKYLPRRMARPKQASHRPKTRPDRVVTHERRIAGVLCNLEVLVAANTNHPQSLPRGRSIPDNQAAQPPSRSTLSLRRHATDANCLVPPRNDPDSSEKLQR